MIRITQKGNWDKTRKFLGMAKTGLNLQTLKKYGEEGVRALSKATPVDTGLTADSWYYKIVEDEGRLSINFCNSNIQNGIPIAIILQYGHATNNGGWVEGRNYINPAIQPIFDRMTNEAWKEVTNR